MAQHYTARALVFYHGKQTRAKLYLLNVIIAMMRLTQSCHQPIL